MSKAEQRETVRREFARQASNFEASASLFRHGGILAWIAGHIDIPQGARILDVAGGTGQVGRHLAGDGATAVIVDLTDAMLAAGLRSVQREGRDDVVFVRGDATDLPFPDDQFDVGAWEGRLEIIIAIALGLAAIVTAGSVYLNEHQEHKANLDFHQATQRLLAATAAGLRSPEGRALEASSAHEVEDAEDHQEKAADYTLAEVILATSLFLFGVAGISSRWRIKIGALSFATLVFLIAVVVLATV